MTTTSWIPHSCSASKCSGWAWFTNRLSFFLAFFQSFLQRTHTLNTDLVRWWWVILLKAQSVWSIEKISPRALVINEENSISPTTFTLTGTHAQTHTQKQCVKMLLNVNLNLKLFMNKYSFVHRLSFWSSECFRGWGEPGFWEKSKDAEHFFLSASLWLKHKIGLGSQTFLFIYSSSKDIAISAATLIMRCHVLHQCSRLNAACRRR